MANVSGDEVNVTIMESVQNTTQRFSAYGGPLFIANAVLSWAMSITGMCANSVVLVVLILARRHYGSHINTLIANQAAMDLTACTFFFIMMLFGMGKYDLGLGKFGNDLICCVFRNIVITGVSRNAGNIGLIND